MPPLAVDPLARRYTCHAAVAWMGGWTIPEVRGRSGASAERWVSQKSGPGKYLAPSVKTM